MKKQILLSIITIFITLPMYAQSYYSGDSATKNGVTYKCKHMNGIVVIYNQSNQLQDVEMTFKDGTQIDLVGNLFSSAEKIATADNPYTGTQIVEQVFGETLVKKLKEEGEVLILSYTLGSNGNISEMSFIFMDDSPFMDIAPNIFYQIEVKIKKNLKYTLREESSKYNIIKLDSPMFF